MTIAKARVQHDDIGEIEDGIPLPPQKRGPDKYKWTEMKEGQSRFIVAANPTSLRNSLRESAARAGVTVECRLDTKDGADGIRVWRVADRHKGQATPATPKARHK